jgi:hypothetical protein
MVDKKEQLEKGLEEEEEKKGNSCVLSLCVLIENRGTFPLPPQKYTKTITKYVKYVNNNNPHVSLSPPISSSSSPCAGVNFIHRFRPKSFAQNSI